MRRTAGIITSVAPPPCSKLLVLAGLLAAVALTTEFGYGQGPGDSPTVDDVIIVGLQSFWPQHVKAILKTSPGQPYNAATVREDLERLGAIRAFKPPRVEVQSIPGSNSVKVFFIVEKYPDLVR